MFRILLTMIWLSVLATGMLFMTHYSTRPGEQARVLESLPNSPSITKTGMRTLWIYLHPHCPCSQATVRQLSRLLPVPEDTQVIACCFLPEDSAADWVEGSLWNAAEQLTSAAAFRDYGGVEAKRFGVHTSGHVMLFDAQGELSFSGGVTAGRGHEGDSPSWIQLQELLSDLESPNFKSQKRHSFPVYGCPIFAEAM